MATYSRPRLVDESDSVYQQFLQHIRLQRDNQRAMRPPRQRDLFGGEAEAALRDWLATQFSLSPKRIVEYQQRKGRNLLTKYRELDALVLTPPKQAQVFEIKATMRANSLRRAMRQLRETQTILSLLYPHVTLTVLLVDTGIPTDADIAALLADPETPQAMRDGLVPPPPTLAQVLETLPELRLVSSLDERPDDKQTIALLRFGVDDIVALAGRENLHLDWSQDDEEEDEEAPPAPKQPIYSTEDDPDEDNNPLAAALRKAMQQGGG